MGRSSAGPVGLAILGAGSRGARTYAEWCRRHPDQARVVAVADPDPRRAATLADAHAVPAERRFPDWRTLLARPRLCDAAVVATPDREHVDPALAALGAGYDVLLEKPIAPTPDGVRRLARAADDGTAVTVAHVLRYTPFFTTVKSLLDAGRIGELATVEHTENVGWWHFAHSYVRGSWRRADAASPLLLAKACHDLDLLRWLAGAPCRAVASFGSLHHFRRENAPPGAPARCLDGCPAEDTCPFHAGRFYLDRLAGWDGPPVTALTSDLSHAGRLAALRDGPYGRCVYQCDNDVPDRQVVALEFTNGVTATLTVSAFTADSTRTVRYMGSRGEISGDLERGEIRIRTFTGREPGEVVRVGVPAEALATTPALGAFLGHAGGDDGLMSDFVSRLRHRRTGQPVPPARTSLEQAVESHLMAFAAEESRLSGRVVTLAPSGQRDRLHV